MKNISTLLFALASVPFAAQFKPFVLANAGLTIPKTEIDDLDEDVDQTDVLGYSATFGLGARMPVTPQLDFEISAGYSLISGGLELKSKSTTEESYYDYDTYTNVYYDVTNTTEVTVGLTPKLVNLEGALSYRVKPNIAVTGGLVYSIPVGGNYEYEMTFKSVSDCPAAATSCEDSYSSSRDDDGKIDDFADDADVKVKSFMSLKLGGEYVLNDRTNITAAWLLPLGDYFDEEDTKVSWSRLTVGVQYSFDMPTSPSSPNKAPVTSTTPATQPTPDTTPTADPAPTTP